MELYVVMHKNIDIQGLSLDSVYKPLLVGAEGKKLNSTVNLQLDNSGENISTKNKNFCELTGLYWIWKNSQSDITGIVHYRRFFKDSNKLLSYKILREDKILHYLSSYDVILPSKWLYKENIYNEYERNHNIEDLNKCRNIISQIYPDYLLDFDKVMNMKSAYLYNMIICRKNLLDEYCRWLFDILFELEKETDLINYDDYQKRIYGFLSERLLNVWIYHNNLKIKGLDIIKTDDKKSKNISRKIKSIAKKVVYRG